MDWKNVLLKVAPTVAAGLGGPLAGSIVSALGSAFGIDEPTKEKIQEVIESGQLSGQQIADLKALEIKLQAEEKERGFRYAELEFKAKELEAKDRSDARDLYKTTGDKTPRNITYIILLSFIGVVISTLFGWTQADSVLAGTLIGYLSAKAEQAIAFWIGSTDSSKQKNQLLLQAKVGEK